MRNLVFLGTLSATVLFAVPTLANPDVKGEVVGSVVQIVARNSSSSTYNCSLSYTIYWRTYGDPMSETYTKSVAVPPNSNGAVVVHTGGWSASTLRVGDVESRCSVQAVAQPPTVGADSKCPPGLVHLGDVKYENRDGKSGFALRTVKIPEGFYIDTRSPINFAATTAGGGAVSKWDGRSAPNGLWIRTWGEKYWSVGNDVGALIGFPSINPSLVRAQDSVSIGLYCGAAGQGFATLSTYCEAHARFCAKPGSVDQAKHQYWDTTTPIRKNMLKDFPDQSSLPPLTPLPGSPGHVPQ